MKKEIKKSFTVQEKVQKVLQYLLILAFLSGPLFILQLDGKVSQRAIYAYGLTVAVVILFALWLGSRMLLPLFIKDKDPANDEDEMFP